MCVLRVCGAQRSIALPRACGLRRCGLANREMQRLMGLRWRHSHVVNFVVNLAVYFTVVAFFWLSGYLIGFGEGSCWGRD